MSGLPARAHAANPPRRPSVLLGAVFILTALASLTPARAQSLDEVLPPDTAGVAAEPDVTVLARRRPELTSMGVRAGAFIIRPNLTEGIGYDTNVLGTSKPQGSLLIQTAGGIAANTEQSRGILSSSLTFTDSRYPDQPHQSHTDWAANLGGSYYLGYDIFSAQYTHQSLSQTAQSLGVSQNLNRPVPYYLDDARLSYRAEFGRSFLVPALEVANYSFPNANFGDTVYLQNYRSRIVAQPSLTAGYEFATRREVIVVVRDSIASYSTALPGMATRNYSDVTLLAGLDYDVSGIVHLRALAGYETRDFQSSQYQAVQAPVIEGSVVWNPTGLTTVTATLTRRIQDAGDETTAAVTETLGSLRIDHEYLRDLLLQANTSIEVDSYPGNATQTLYNVGAGATYFLNRNASVATLYNLGVRHSSGGSTLNFGATGSSFGSNYIDNLFQLQLRFRL